MPDPIVTLETLIADVKVALGYLDDGVADPLLEQHIIGALNRGQRQLEKEHPWMAQRRAFSLSINALQRYFDLPEAAIKGRIERMLYTNSDGSVTSIFAGIDPTLENISGIPNRYDISPSTGIIRATVAAGGTGYSDDSTILVSGGTMAEGGVEPEFSLTTSSGVITAVEIVYTGAGWSEAPTLVIADGTGADIDLTLGPVQVVELFPTPDAGTVSLEYYAGAVDMEDETDEASIDREALVGRASWLVASSPGRRMANSDQLLAQHNAYIQATKVLQRPSNGFTLMRNLTQPARTIFRNP